MKNVNLVSVDKVIKKITELGEVVSDLHVIYDNNEDLNNLQPPCMGDIIPASLDDWWFMIQKCKADWEKIRKKMVEAEG